MMRRWIKFLLAVQHAVTTNYFLDRLVMFLQKLYTKLAVDAIVAT
jgi:hypothetical protein